MTLDNPSKLKENNPTQVYADKTVDMCMDWETNTMYFMMSPMIFKSMFQILSLV